MLRNVVFMGVPSMIGFATTTVCALVEVYYLGLLGSSAVAGMTLLGAFAGVLSTSNSIVGAGSVAIISRRYGEKDYGGTENAIKQTLILKFAVAVVSGCIGLLLLSTILNWMNAKPEVARLGFEYGVWFFIMLPFNFCSWSMFTAFRGIGDARRAMSLMLLTTGLNIAIAPILIFGGAPISIRIGGLNLLSKGAIIGFGLGISGAAIAKGLSLLICCIVGLMMLHSYKTHIGFRITRGWKPDLEVMKKIMKIGTPPGLEGIAKSMANFATTYFIALYGTAVVAAYGIASQILGFTIVAAVGMQLGSAAIVGHCLGAGRGKMAAETVRLATTVVVIICAILGILAFIFAPQIISVFTEESDVAAEAITVIRIMVFGYLLFAFRLVLASAFNGSGNTIPPTVISLSAEGTRIALIAVLIYAFQMNQIAVWWAFVIASSLDATMLWVWYKKAKWIERCI
ncbi:MAG: MATE family efflux transporter [Candidatus Coatesbacteria bacterium]|nr:MATE family efflux transporter [Candidatus Coatesbacteria bacterium]